MKIDIQPLEDHQVKLTAEISPEPLEQAKRRAAREIARKTKIPGFRPGKAPYAIVQRFVGEETILDEGLEILIRDIYPKIIEEAGIQPYGPGKFENVASLDPLRLEFTIPLMAEIQLGDYRSIRFPYEAREISDQEVDEFIERLRQRKAVEEPVERPAQPGDRVELRLQGRRLQPKEGENPTLVQERAYSTILAEEGADDSLAWPFPGFSRQLIGLSAGETKTLTHTFSEDSEFEALRGEPAEFVVTVEQVKERRLPEADGEFARSIRETYESMEDLRAEVRASLERQVLEEYEADYDEKTVNAVVEQSTIKYPPQMLEHEIEEVIHQLANRLKAQNLDLETYMKTRGIDAEGLRQEARPVAENRLKRSLVLLEIAEAEGIEIEKEELQSETERTLEAMTRFMSEAELRKVSTNDLIPDLVGNILAEMRIKRTLERLRSIAKGEREGDEPGAAEMEAERPESPAADAPVEAEGETGQAGSEANVEEQVSGQA